jgi:hypothetical protein
MTGLALQLGLGLSRREGGEEVPANAIISVSGGSVAEPTVDATPRKIEAWDTDGPSENMTPDHAGNDITAGVAGIFSVVAQVSFSGSGAGTFIVEIRKNGGATGFKFERKLSGSGDVGVGSAIGILNLAADNTVELFQSTSNGDAMTISEAQLAVIRISS